MIATSSTVAPLMKTSSDSDFISYKLPNPCESCLGTITMLTASIGGGIFTSASLAAGGGGGTIDTTLKNGSTNAVQNTNDLPTGQLVINGTAKIGETLTLDTSTIQDEDGPTSLSFSYTWHRSSDGDNWTAISNATGSSYTIVDADAHHEIKAKVIVTIGAKIKIILFALAGIIISLKIYFKASAKD